ncbi:hypothetical protein CWE09_08010 [Aliidiomarina minuta]|uniref:Penicillin-binding protein activator n=2 Tax=Aliidiomarina minuta TaxID=880057 RepID=A0A432W9A1_9GAMM|nr:hypothetical protein CWE09_08010 [Aliidiomarina minuta]
MAILILSACGSQPESPTDDPEATLPVAPELLPADSPDPDHWLQQARQADRIADREAALVHAAAAFFENEQWRHGGVVLSQVDTLSLSNQDLLHYRLQRARLQIHFQQWEEAINSLSDIEQRLRQREQRQLAMQLRYQAYAGQQRYLSAARQLVELQRYDDNDYSQLIWNNLTQVPADYWRQAVREPDEQMRGWTSLLTRITQALDHREPVAEALQRWQNNFHRHPANTQVSNLLEHHSWLQEQPRRIAVLLPLSGQFASQGTAVRDGILAALSNERDEDVFFINTQVTDPDVIQQKLYDENIEAVIGPLDREYSERLAATFNAHDEPRPWVHIWLNQPPSDYQPAGDTFFALDVDTEVQMATGHLRQKGYQQVLILGPDTQRGRQLSGQFEQQWRDYFGNHSTRVGLYSSSTDIRDIVEERLHVTASKQRIALIERTGGDKEIESEARSRNDLDAIFLVGDATQARLLKPFIDMSISAFAQTIPVYATSSVHEQTQGRSENDLDGITFSEAPWLLPAHDSEYLFKRFAELRSNWTPSTQRLIAMGYDSMFLLPRLTSMNWFPGYNHAGLTGQLRIQQHSVVRELDWATFDQHQIKLEPANEHEVNWDFL